MTIRLTPRARQVLAHVRRDSGATRSMLIRDTGLSGTATFRATEELAAAGLVRAGDAVADGRGQPSAAIHLVPEAAFAIGLSVMTDRAEVALMDLAGTVLCRRDVTSPGMKRDAILGAVEDFLTDARTVASFDRRRLLGMGLAITGFFVDPAVVNPSSELDDWALVDLDDAVSRRLALPVIVENIGNASAIGERLLGVAADIDAFAYLNVATGFGAGLFVGGELMRGRHGNAGEISILLTLSGRPTPNLLSLQQAAAAQGVPTDSIAELLARYDDRWPWLDDWARDHAPAFSHMAAIMRYVLDCEAIIIGGRIPRLLAERVVSRMTWPEATGPTRRGRPAPAPRILVAALTAEDSATLGAATLPLMRWLFA